MKKRTVSPKRRVISKLQLDAALFTVANNMKWQQRTAFVEM
jgi:hypothetical protein